MTAVLEAAELAVSRGTREVVRVDRLVIEEGETLVLLGPNGAGKSTLILALASLLPVRGEIRFRGAAIRDEVAYRRRIAVAFQRPLLLDRSVLDNAALGLELRAVARPERERRAAEVLAQLGVGHLARRPAWALSGGEAQRVSIARSLAVRPEVLFLDEPFAGLDAPSRESAIADLARAVRDERITTVLVTHDRDEALSLADRIAVIIGGRLRQVDRAEAVFASPADPEVAAFVGVENILPARVESSDDELTRLAIGDLIVEVTATPPRGETATLVGIPPDDIVISREPQATSARNAFVGRIVRVEPIGRRVRVVLDCGFPLVAHVTHRSARELALRPGDEVVATFKATVPHLLPLHRRN
ncbi:MAG TPA: ABC transporter ATP-binding protein [Candidatus Limnocylindria bacterium]|jgi:tungstate transport system ATP-binding protein|nr:ABC transporter ATP-binding protein [Candidatus Limnocylindria bacterium]